MHRLFAVTILLLAACAARPPASEFSARVQPVSDAVPVSAGALVVSVDRTVVDRAPDGQSRPLTAGATLITGPYNVPLGASASEADSVLLLRDAAWPPAPGAGAHPRATEQASRRFLVPLGWEGVIDLRSVQSPGGPVSLVIAPRASHASPGLALRAPARVDESARAGGAAVIQTIRIPWPLPEPSGQFLLAISHEGGTRYASLWRIRVEAAPADDATAAEIADLRAATAPSPASSNRWSRLGAQLGAVDPAELRRSLQFAALDLGADLTGEAAAVATDEELPMIAGGVSRALSGLDAHTSGPEAAWAADRATLLTIATLQRKNKLGRATGALVSARLGEVGREPALAADLARGSATAADFDQRVKAEHLVFLDDASPAARVRAFDWLTARAAAPAGYNPLGPERERRAAVEAYLEQLQAKP
jgi:hypothetical protein